MHQLVLGEEFSTAANVSDQQFPIDEIVAAHFVAIEKPIESRCKRWTV